MSQPSTQHLRDLTPSADRPRYARESIQRIMIFGLPSYERSRFFPQAGISGKEGRLMENSPDFVQWGSVHLLMLRLAQHPKVDGDIRSRINTRKAGLFFPACVQRKPPPSSQSDPVVEYGWDRTCDKDLIQRMQDQCAQLFMACDHLAYMRAAPEMEQYCQNDPAEWYKRLTSHLASPMYKIDLKAKIKAGIEPLRDTLSDLFTKLSILHDAAHGQDLKPRPQEVMVDLCTRVGIPALDELDLNDEAKEEIRNLFESIEQMARQDTHFDFQVYLYGMLEAAVRFDFAAVFLNATDGMDILNGLGAILARTIGILELPWIRDKLIEAEMAKFVKGVGERLGRMYGLWN